MSRFDERLSTLPCGRRHPRRSQGARAALLLATTALTCPVLINPVFAQHMPNGGSVAAGSVAIAQPSATQLTITQSSQSAVVNWQSFSIGQGYAVNIVQPNASSAILNRVTGNTPSTIAGSLTANGQVYLVNPNGIAITKSGTVNTAGFVASTLGISDGDFMNGKRTFTGNGASAGVSNAGSITVGRGGYAALIGGTVSNSGSISVPLGKVGLGSGERATLDFSGDGFLQVAAPTNAGGNGALIKNAGSIRADGGSVIISAATAREAARNAINISGLVQARSIGGHNGSIMIGGGAGGRVRIAGRLDASSRHHGGGTITVTGQQIKLKAATVDASGKTGGGIIRIGGDAQGGGTLQQAQSVSMDAATTIRADATGAGNGGEVVLWSTGTTSVRGLITATGGPNGGNGGSVETSGHALDFTGVTVNTSAPAGKTGSWLLDPTDLTVDAAAAATINGDLATTNVTLQTTATTTSGPGTTSGGPGDINIYAPLSWSSANTLTLSAYNSINIVSSIIATGNGKLVLTTNNNIGGSNNAGALNFLSGGNIELLGSSAALTINGTAYTLIHSVTDLVNVNNNLSGTYALAGPLDLSGHTYTDGVIAPSTGGGFLGTFNGLGNTISNLTINAPTATVVGLFGQIGDSSNNSVGTVGNLVLSGGSVTATAVSTTVGALAGTNTGTVFNVSASTSVTATANGAIAGGLVGYNWGTMTNVHASGNVTDTVTGSWVGGLVGYNDGYPGGVGVGTITNAYATGTVTGGGGTGGVDTGSGSGSSTGGLIGINLGTVINAYAAGAVHGGASSDVGGLIGQNDTTDGLVTVTNAYWDTTTSGISSVGTGGGTGLTTTQLKNGTLPTGFSSSVWSAVSGLYPFLGPKVLTVSLSSQTATYGTAYSLNQTSAAYSETLGGTALTGGSFVTLSGQSITVAGTGSSSGTTTSTNAGNYLLSAAGATASGYIVNYGSSAAYLTVNPLAVTLTGSRTYNGGTSISASSLTLTNGVSGATATSIGLTGTGSVASANVIAGAQALNLTGLSVSNSNYTVSGGSGTVTINPLAVTLTGSQTYNGQTTITASLTASNKVSGDTLTITGAPTGTLAAANAGSQAMSSLSGLSLSNSNYTLTGGTGTVTVNPLAVTLTGSQTYNGLTGALASGLTVTNVISGDTVGLAGTGVLASKNAGSEALTSTVGALSGLTVSNSNYTVTGGSGTVNVLRLALNGTLGAGSSTYGSALAPGALTFTNRVAGDVVAAGAVTVTTAGLTSSSGNLIAGTHTGIETVGGSLSGADAGNYTFAGATGNYTVTPLALSGTIGAGSSTYGSALAPGATNFTNAVAGDALGTATIAVNTAGLTSSSGHLIAGTHAGIETVSALSGADAGNYSFAGVTGNYTVTPLALSGTIGAGSSIYGSVLAPGTASLTGSIAGDALGTATITVNTAGLTSSSGHLIAGTHTGIETVGALSGADGGNYSFAGVTGNYTVTPLALNGTLGAGNSIYGSALAPGALTFTNRVTGDVVAAGAVTVTTAGLTSSSGNLIAGTHTGIESVGGSLSGADAGNYTFAGATGNYTVTALALSGTIGAGSSTYGSVLAPGTASLTGSIAGDVLGAATVAVNTAGLTSSSGHLIAGTHAGIETVSALSGADAGNYTFAGVTGNYTVTPLTLNGTLGAGSSIYGSALAPGALTFTNRVAGDVVAAGAVTVTTAGLTSSSGNLIAGTHTGIETVGGSLSGADAGNYTFAGATGNYTVTPLALSGTIGAGSSTYGSALAPGATNFTNAVAGDALGTATIAVNTAGLTSSSGHLIAGTHAGIETVSALSGADAGNYSFAGVTGNYTVTPLALSGTIGAGSSIYGSVLAPGTASLTGSIAGDALGTATITVNTAGLTSSSGHLIAGTHTGIETVGALSGADGGNYSFAGVTGNYTVTPLALNGTLGAGNSIYGSALAPGALTFTNRVTGDVVAAGAVTVTTAGLTSSSGNLIAGTHTGIESVGGSLSGADAGNYTFAGATGNYTVTASPSVAPALLASRVVNDSFDALALPNNAKPVFAVADAGTGVFYADPHFDQVYVCFGGGGGTAQSCVAAGNGAH